MKTKMCDKCGAVNTKDNRVRCMFRAVYDVRAHEDIASWDGFVEYREQKEFFDLCDICADEIYRSIRGRSLRRKYLDEWATGGENERQGNGYQEP